MYYFISIRNYGRNGSKGNSKLVDIQKVSNKKIVLL